MPFQEPHVEYFTGIIAPAAREAGLIAFKADDIYGTAPIIQDIWSQIWGARAVIADVTGKNPNVNYELGICHALGVPTVLISQSINDVPFDYRHIRCIIYDTKRVDWQDKLRHAITATLRSLLSGGDTYEDLRWPYDTHALQAIGNSSSLIPAEEGTASVIKGARLVRDACGPALGPHGTNVSLSPSSGPAHFDRSGSAIANATRSADPLKQQGVEHARRLVQEMSVTVGDGSKTAVLIFQELVEGGFEAIQNGFALRDLIHEMDVAVETAVRNIQRMSRIPSKGDVAAVARTASVGDEQIGATVAEALTRTGPNGVISLLEGADAASHVEIREGIYFDRGFISSRFINDETRQTAELNDTTILIYDSKISSMKQLLPILEQVAKGQVPLLVIAQDVEGEALETMAVNKERGTLNCVAVRAPLVRDGRQYLLEDIAVATGGTVISSFSQSLESVRLNQLGRAKHVEVNKNTCWITGGAGDERAIDARAAGIKQQISIEKSDFEIERLRERLAKLAGRICEIQVGGASSLDREERMYKMKSALRSAQESVSQGTVPGGGLVYYKAGRRIRSESQASQIVGAALAVPLIQQIDNAREDPHEVVGVIDGKLDSRHLGLNAETGKIVDLRRAGIIDPTKTCVRAVELAFVHARAILQTGVWNLGDKPVPQTPKFV